MRSPGPPAISVLALATACVTQRPGRDPRGAVARLAPPGRALRQSLAAAVRTLSVEIGERNVGHPQAYDRAAGGERKDEIVVISARAGRRGPREESCTAIWAAA